MGAALLIGAAACGGESRTSHADSARANGGSSVGGSRSSGGASSGALGGAAAASGSAALEGGGAGLGGATAGGQSVAGAAAGDFAGGAAAGQASTEVPLDSVSETLAQAYCTLEARCQQGYSTTGFVMPGEDCVMLTKQRLELNGLELLAGAVAAGRVEYHGELMQACSDAIKAPNCSDTIERELPECEAAITGTLALGEPCVLSEECKGSLLCDTRTACPGRCAERYAEGEACSVDDDCADGLMCEPYTGSCAKPVRAGEACEGEDDHPCLPGLYCAKTVTEALTMHRPAGTCMYISHGVRMGTPACDALQGLLCNTEDLNPVGPCVLETLVGDTTTWSCNGPAATGCTLALPDDCGAGQFCPLDAKAIETGVLTSTCKPLPKPGEPCARRPLLSTILPECAPYARCDTSSTCHELGKIGAHCDDNEQCLTGFCADFQCARAHACP